MIERRTLLFALCLGIAGPCAAQAQGGVPVLRVDAGTVMTSAGGEFASATGGEPVEPGHRVMLAEGGRATLVYPNGCTQPLVEAGVYTVAPTCLAASPARAVTRPGLVIGGVVGLGLVAALAGGGGSDDPPPPPPPPPPVSR